MELGSPLPSQSGGSIFLPLLEFKTHFLEVVEELHIRRDAETRYEGQISKMVVEKQELEWEKESLQHQIEKAAKQHTASLTTAKNQFQAKLRCLEEQKGKFQVSAELKDKEINSLKEELKSLQLLKYNLEKKSTELEQKLSFQSRSKDIHLNQLGEVEKQFSALSKQCATVKQAHEKLEQNVEEAMRMNKLLTSVCDKQEATIVSLKKDLDEVNKKFLKGKMTSAKFEKMPSSTGQEHHVQQLNQRLNMETEMNKKLQEENKVERAEKQEVIRSLQHTHQLLLTQTQTVKRVELELKTQCEKNQALKLEHEVMREKSKATEEKMIQLIENLTVSKSSWDKEKAIFLDRIRTEQDDLKMVKEAYNDLHQKHTELSLQANSQMKDSITRISVSTQTTLEEKTSKEAEQTRFSEVQHWSSSKANNPDTVEVTGVLTKLTTTGADGGLDVPHQYQKSPVKPQSILTKNNLFRLCNASEAAAAIETSAMNSNDFEATEERDPNVVSDPDKSNPSNDGLHLNGNSYLSDTAVIGSVSKFTEESVKLPTQNHIEEQNKDMDEKNEEGNDEKENKQPEERKTEQKCGKNEKNGGSAQTSERADDCSEGSADDARVTSNPETETKDRVERKDTEKPKKGRKTAAQAPETEITAQTNADTTAEQSQTLQVIDCMDTEPPSADCEPSDFSLSRSQTVTEKTDGQGLLNKEVETRREVFENYADSSQLNKSLVTKTVQPTACLVEHKIPDSIIDKMQPLQRDEANCSSSSVCHMKDEEIPSKTTVDKIPIESPELLNQSSLCPLQTISAPISSLSGWKIKEHERRQTETSKFSYGSADIKQTDEMCGTGVSELAEPPQSQDTKNNQSEKLVLANEDAGDSFPPKKKAGESDVETDENKAYQSRQKSMETSGSVGRGLDILNAESKVETTNLQEFVKTGGKEIDSGDFAKTAGCETDMKLQVHPSCENRGKAVPGNSKCQDVPLFSEVLPNNACSKSPQFGKKTYRALFDWGATERKTFNSRATFEVSTLHQCFQESPASEETSAGSGGFHAPPPKTIPTSLKSKQSKVPMVIMRASDLLNASSVSGTAASAGRHQHGEREAVAEAIAADTENRATPPQTSPLVSRPSSTSSKLPWQTKFECSRAPTSAAGPSSQSDSEFPCSSQETEDQQSSIRAQIFKLEQFLNTERLRLSKRPRTDN